MKVIVPANSVVQDKRVAFAPEHARILADFGANLWFEVQPFPFPLSEYIAHSATCTEDLDILCKDADVVFSLGAVRQEILERLPVGTRIVGLLGGKKEAKRYTEKKLEAYALELLPRISRAQFLDVLSSQATLMGYWAIVQGMQHLTKIFPMMTTAAGTLTPATVLILGAGVAGLQAIGVAKRMGAKVSACDIRSAAKEQVESLGAKFLQLPGIENAEISGGYARALTLAEEENQHRFFKEMISHYDVIICSALIPGKQAPTLLTEDMLSFFRPGTVIVDLATHMGESGNCTFTQPGKILLHDSSVVSVGALYPLSDLAISASTLYGRNMIEVLKILWNKTSGSWNEPHTDELLKSMCITG